ncbi:glycosyltransferase [Enterovirga rhinocerotis]|uniref:Glycosyl transferase family 2 n=1 Tax=Enterovirga rhinocerotis TaxID=1339210 RepID=A0A4V3DZ30_9HYPH|nr:glycosyltransferase [Enterovirga rhinocerotis]TDR95009.1 glycosyl transferase family 2 [Enterovirga rhinocerotis]
MTIEPPPADGSGTGTTGPLVSILVLTWNHEAYIRASLESMLAESYRNIEIIVCENGSSDGTWAELQRIVAEHPDRAIAIYQNPPGTKVTVGFNSLIARAQGELLCFFSGDDLFHGDRLARQVEAFQDNPDLEIVYSNGRFLGGRKDGELVHDEARFEEVFRLEPEGVLRFVFSNRGMMIQTLMARRPLIEAVGGFDETELADDWILNIRIFGHLTRRSQYAFLPLVSFLYRQHDNNAYKNFPRQSRLMLGVIDKYYHFDDRETEIAKMYYFQANVGAMYGFQHLGMTLGYLKEALRRQFRPRDLVMFPLRFAGAPGLRLYRRLRAAMRPAGRQAS